MCTVWARTRYCDTPGGVCNTKPCGIWLDKGSEGCYYTNAPKI